MSDFFSNNYFTFKCENCNSNEAVYDEVKGDFVCQHCGTTYHSNNLKEMLRIKHMKTYFGTLLADAHFKLAEEEARRFLNEYPNQGIGYLTLLLAMNHLSTVEDILTSPKRMGIIRSNMYHSAMKYADSHSREQLFAVVKEVCDERICFIDAKILELQGDYSRYASQKRNARYGLLLAGIFAIILILANAIAYIIPLVAVVIVLDEQEIIPFFHETSRMKKFVEAYNRKIKNYKQEETDILETINQCRAAFPEPAMS